MARFLPCLMFRSSARGRQDASRRGAFAPEFALIAPVFFLLLMGIVELSMMEGMQQILENAAYNTSRLAKTGYKEASKTQDQTVKQILIQELTGYGALVDLDKVTMTETVYGSFAAAGTGGGTSGYGVGSQIVAYTISYPWKIFTPLVCSAMGSACSTESLINLTSTIVVRNEPY
jgi:Flp pilus assembly protein TadG